MDWLVGWLVSCLVGWLVGIIDVQVSWLMTGKSLVSIAPLIGKKIEEVGGEAGAAAQVTTVVPLKFGVSVLTNKYKNPPNSS